MSESKRIYCDESGFTGNHLSSNDQQFFSFSAVHVSPEEATSLVSDFRKSTGTQEREPKANRILRSAAGRRNIVSLLEELEGKRKVIVSNKLFCLAAKFYEYVFEPLLAAKSSIFYEIDFHRFISNYIYYETGKKNAYSRDLLLEFEEGMRKGEYRDLPVMAGSLDLPVDETLGNILDFCRINIEKVNEESAFPKAEGYERWILDLSSTSMHSLLAEWHWEVGSLSVLCDDSKPLVAVKEIVEAFGKRDEVVTLMFQGEERKIGYKLDGPVEFGDSSKNDGLILADIVASSMSWCMKNWKEGKKIRETLAECVSGNSVFPFEEFVDFRKPEVVANNILLKILLQKSRIGKPLLEDIESDVISASRQVVLESGER